MSGKDGEDEGFLQRWSRRKTAETAVAPEPVPVDVPAEKPEAVPPEKAVEEPFDLSKLPSIESLGKNSDYSMFMHKAVPEDLRLQALRRMWTTDPVLAAPDLLDMHQLDYTGNDGVRPLVHPALDAIAALAKEALERSRRAADTPKGEGDSPDETEAVESAPDDAPKSSSG